MAAQAVLIELQPANVDERRLKRIQLACAGEGLRDCPVGWRFRPPCRCLRELQVSRGLCTCIQLGLLVMAAGPFHLVFTDKAGTEQASIGPVLPRRWSDKLSPADAQCAVGTEYEYSLRMTVFMHCDCRHWPTNSPAREIRHHQGSLKVVRCGEPG